ncbi:MAG: FtsX-like permease family protein [Vicinamibacterales bacterium]
MSTLLKIAVRNLMRYRRRSLLTASLIAIGVIAVVVFEAASGAFTGLMIGQMTDAMLGHVQIHRRGYVASIDNLPLTMMLTPDEVAVVDTTLRAQTGVESYSRRLKFGAMFSNYTETTALRLNGVYPEDELRTLPLLASRIKQGTAALQQGQIIIPDLLASGMKVKLGDTVVVIATNRDGSVNAAQLVVSGVLANVTGPTGRDGYVHIEDATTLLRMDAPEISEIAIRLKDFGQLDRVAGAVRTALQRATAAGQLGETEVHTWEGLSPFYNVAVLISILALSATLGLVAIVLVSVMNVMLMSVYERVKEIGTIAAMGTMPRTILGMFVIEGFSLGVLGILIGDAVAAGVILVIAAIGPTFNFGRETGLVLSPQVDLGQMLVISAVVLAVAVIGTVQPAFKASRMEPVDALRHG